MYQSVLFTARAGLGGLTEPNRWGIAPQMWASPGWSRQTWGHHERSFPQPAQPGEIVQRADRRCGGVRGARGALYATVVAAPAGARRQAPPTRRQLAAEL